MNEVSNLSGTQAVTPVPQRPAGERQGPAQVEYRSPKDQVEISEVGAMMAKLKDIPDVRVEKIERLRAEIAAGTFETRERLDGTVDRMMEELF